MSDIFEKLERLHAKVLKGYSPTVDEARRMIKQVMSEGPEGLYWNDELLKRIVKGIELVYGVHEANGHYGNFKDFEDWKERVRFISRKRGVALYFRKCGCLILGSREVCELLEELDEIEAAQNGIGAYAD